jgi:thiopeptide-type bacteriocin biosynthesis protein
MSEGRKRLRDEVRLSVVYEDQTPYGSVVSGRADEVLRSACAGIAEYRKRHGVSATVARSRELLEEVFTRDLSPLYRTRETLREDCLFPAVDRVWPAALTVSDAQQVKASIPLDAGCLPELASWMFEMQQGTVRPSSAAGRALFDQLETCGALTEDPVQTDSPASGDAVLVGHAMVMLTRGARVLIDPFILPRSNHYPRTYQPHRAADLLPLDGVLITHSHPDHFDPGTLIRLGPHVPVYVPEVERESLLAIDMAARLEQLGFSNVHRIRPGAEFAIGEVGIQALPFFGEQPTTGASLHPDVRNVGCTYLCASGGRRLLALADSGRDGTGDVRELAAGVRMKSGDIDVVFGGYRGFAMYPILYLFSSVSRYLLFVPPADLTFRQEIMNDSDALIDTAERCGSRYIVPYATGGAPWYWERGLGWAPSDIANARNDPPPDEVIRAAAGRGRTTEGLVPSPVRVLALNAGEALVFGEGDATVEHGPLQVWPYDPPAWHQVNLALTAVDGSMLNSAGAVFGKLEPALNEWRKEQKLRRFFFMRKPPGLRLRFLADKALSHEISALLDDLMDKGSLDAWMRSVYEPETDRFGGAAAMEAVHEWFDSDSMQWMAVDRSRRNGGAVITRDALCAAVAQDLVKATLPDRSEMWAVWRLYASANGLGPVGTNPERFGDVAYLGATASPAEQKVLYVYQEANQVLSARLLSCWQDGKLTAGIRSVLATIVLFHFNRHGLDPAAHSRIAWSMISALDPSVPGMQQLERR